MKKTFLSIIKKPKNRVFIFIMSLLVFILLRIIPVFEILKDFYSLAGITAVRKISIFYEYTLLSFFDTGLLEQILLVLLSVFSAFNILFFILFARRQKKMLSKRSFFAAVSGMFFGLFGVGCISCGAFVLAPIITFLGFGAYIGFFTAHALLITCIGIGLVFLSAVYLLHNLSQPLVCK